MDYCTIASLATAVVALAGLNVWVLYVLTSRHERRRSVGYIVWLVHVLVFGIVCAVFDPGHQKAGFEVWCSAVKLHGVIQVAADGLFSLIRRHKFKSLADQARRTLDD